MIIVSVSINGSGPYDFMLDTGCSNTMIDQKLATQLELPQVGEGKIIGVLGSSIMSIVRANSVSVDGDGPFERSGSYGSMSQWGIAQPDVRHPAK
jgi:hypothetical protein